MTEYRLCDFCAKPIPINELMAICYRVMKDTEKLYVFTECDICITCITKTIIGHNAKVHFHRRLLEIKEIESNGGYDHDL